MAQENETAYSVNARYLPDLEVYPYEDIEQIYFTPAKVQQRFPETTNIEWRVRKATTMNDNVGYKTAVKFGDKSSGPRIEVESDIPFGAFGTRDEDIDNYAHGIVRKRRYNLGEGFVLDVYDPDYHGGLILAEKEYVNPKDRQLWTPPDWCLYSKDVPSNRMIALDLHPFYKTRDADERSITLDELQDALHYAQHESSRMLVTVSGVSGSGKSSLSKWLASELQASVIEVDHLHIGATELSNRHGEVNHDLPGAYDYVYAGQLALQLARGNPINMPRYDYVSAEPSGDTTVVRPTPSGNVIIDGLYASQLALTEAELDITTRHILVDTPLYVSVIRRLLRDATLLSTDCERPVQFSPEETLQYMLATALPTYLGHQDRSSFDYLVQ